MDGKKEKVLKNVKRIAMICATPYHIYNAINLKVTIYYGECIDLFIINDFEDSLKYYESIIKRKLFNNVYLIKRPKINTGWDKWKMRYSLLTDRMKYFTKENFNEYNLIATGVLESFSIIFMLNQKKKNPNLEFIVIEDGMGDYVSDRRMKFDSKIYRFRKINMSNYINKMWMYKPDISLYKKEYKNISTIPTPTNESIEILTEIFQITDTITREIVSNNIIYLDQPIEETNWSLSRANIIEKLVRYLKKEDFVVKRHPRKQDFDYAPYKVKVLPELQVPWEVIGAKLVNKVLITFNSSAALTPKFIYNNNNKVIFLYKYFMKDDPLCLEWDKFFYKVKDMYPEHIFIPETEKDLIDVLDQVKEWVGIKNGNNN